MNRLFVDNLTVIDFSYLHALRGIVGESWIVDIELSGELDEQGMVFDFGHVKKQLKTLIDTEVDHKLLIPRHMDGLLVEKRNHRIDIGFHNHIHEKWLHRSPDSSVLLLDGKEVTQETVASYLIDQFNHVLPENIDGVSVTIRSEELDTPFYHYSHGLKKHDGNCQRIAHGHRSKIEIYLDEKRSPTLEQEWAETFKDIYIGTREDVIEDNPHADTVAFGYESEQGRFELTLPARQVYLIDTDSTVEFIAQHITREIKKQHPAFNVLVKAYEGVGKGAIAEL